MRSVCRPVVAPAALALLAVLPAPAVALAPPSPTTLASSARATVVGAEGDWTAWSASSGGRYRLVTRSPDGVVSTPKLPSRRVPFDLDLGRDARGRVIAAFSRCKAKEPTLVGGANASAPNYATGRGCRVSLFDLAAGTERRLGLSRGSRSDVLPSVGGARIAFVSLPRARRLRGKAELRWRTAARTRSTLLDRGPWRGGSPNVAGGPAGVDTDGVRVAAVWRGLDPEFNSFDSVLRVQRYTGKPRQVAFGTNNDVCNYNQVLAPTLDGTSVSYLRTNGSGWVLQRTSVLRDAPSYGASRAGEPGVVVTGAALDRERLVVAETAAAAGVGHAAGPTEIRALAAAPFAAGTFGSFCDG